MKNKTKTSNSNVNDYPEYEHIRNTIVETRKSIMSSVNFAMVKAYWDIGRVIYNAQNGHRAAYGKQLIKYTSQKLSDEFGKGFDERNLRNMRQFYKVFQNWNTLCSELSWSHYRLLMRIPEVKKREYYMKECAENAWSVRQLERQINSFYYERLLASSNEKLSEVKNEIKSLEPNTTPEDILKDPYVLEFLGLEENKAYLEKELEQALIENLQKFLLELGKGFSFVARQKRITIDGDSYYVDLVFYNYILKCFVLIDLKAHKLSYQDIGQIDFYVKYFEENIKTADDNPTIGIVLCSEKNETMVKYSVLAENEYLYATKYKLYIPTEDELKREVERERFNIEQQFKNDE